jgi:protein TonB
MEARMRRTSLIVLGFVLVVSITLSGAPISAQQQLAPYRVGGPIRPPAKITHVAPVYPEQARSARIQGVVILEITLDGTGHVSDAKILRSIPLLDQAALNAVRQWEYEPVLLNGVPVPIIMTATVNFALGQPTGGAATLVGGVSGVAGSTTSSTIPLPARDQAGRWSFTSGRPGFIEYYDITDARLARLPSWDLAKVLEPPLSPGAAILAAQTWLGQREPVLAQSSLLGLNLVRAASTWIYHVRLTSMVQGRPATGEGRTVYVLLDGTVLEPTKVEKQP